MRILGRSLLLLLVLAGLLTVSRLDWEPLFRFSSRVLSAPRQERVLTVSSQYLLDREGWTQFDLPAGVELLRLLSNAILPATGDPFAGEPVAYSLRYQLLDSEGRLLAEHVYHHSSRVVPHRDPETGGRELAAYYFTGGAIPAEGRIALLNLRGLAGVARLRLRMGPAGDRVGRVGVRVYFLEKTAEHKLGTFWKRLSERQKQELAAGSVYPHELLLPEEKRNLARQLWKPVGPAGVEGQDYRTERLYSRGDLEEARFDDPILPAGMKVARDLYGILSLPEGETRLRLRLYPLPPLPESSPGPVRLRWYGAAGADPRQWDIPWSPGEMVFTATLVGGLIEIESPSPLVARAFRVLGDQVEELTPETIYNRSYHLNSEGGLIYRVAHVGATATPLRIDLRRLEDPARPPASTVDVVYQLCDATGTPRQTGTLAVPCVPCRYEYLADAAAVERLCEPVRFYFRLPPELKEIRFSSASPVLASAYTRPFDLERELRVPEDYLMLVDEDQRQPAWFGLRPVEHERLLRENRSALLLVRRRPPEADARATEIAAGRYLWEDFHPQGDWLARQVLTPVDGARPTRPEALAATFRPLPVGRETVLELGDAYARPTLSPELLYLRDRGEPAPFAVLVDGRMHHQGLLVGREGRLPLPPLSTGHRRLLLETDSRGRFLLNSTAGSGPAYLKRLVNRLDKAGLTFVIDHAAGAETLSGRLFVPSGRGERSRLRVTLLDVPEPGSGPFAEWTFVRRRFDLAPAAGAPVPVLQAAGEVVDGGQAFFIPLDSDLPAGRYRLRIELEAGPGGYLSLSRLTPGLFAERVLLRERDAVREPADD